MSGHSKWSTIKHKKAAKDAKKGNVRNILGSLYNRSVLKRFLETEIQHSGE